ncbi:MAG: DinB family protein [Candidatus Acidiferrum sp.]
MQNLQPEQGTLLMQLALPVLKNEHKTTRRVIEAIPLDKGDYRPEPVAKTALEIAWHIAAAEQRFFAGVAAGAFDFNPIHRPETVRNSAELAQWFGESFARNFERLSGLKGEHLVKVLDFRGVLQLPAVMYLEFAVKHSVHHRGQLSTYLRPMGSKVPAIYGESYDSAEAKKAAQA